MRALLSALAVSLVLAVPAHAQLPGGSFFKGVQFIENIAKHSDSAGLRVYGNRLYITTERDLTVYDISNPEAPAELGSMVFPTPGEPTYSEEDPDTNGKIVLVSNTDLFVIDVTDPANPKVAGTIPGGDQHTWSCVRDCSYGYGSEGDIADLRDPAHPKLVGNWGQQYDVGNFHDVTEVAPGIVLTASEPMLLLDARTDPAHPALLASFDPGHFVHQTAWPNGMADKMLLTAGETMGPACSQAKASVFQTWANGDFLGSSQLKNLGTYSLPEGTFTDGKSPYTTWCTHWFSPHPSFSNGGLVAISWYEQGTRFLAVKPDGSITEVGYALPLQSQASEPRWVTDRVVYVSDYYRGLDVLKFTDPIPPPGPRSADPAPVAPKTRGATPPALPGTPPPSPRFGTLVRVGNGCRHRTVTASAKDKRVVSVLLQAGKAKAKGRRSAKLRIPAKGAKVRITAVLKNGTRVAVVRAFKRCA